MMVTIYQLDVVMDALLGFLRLEQIEIVMNPADWDELVEEGITDKKFRGYPISVVSGVATGSIQFHLNIGKEESA